MTRRDLLNILLLSAIVVLGAIAYLVPDPDRRDPGRLTHLDPAAVQRIDIRSTEAGEISLRREAGVWMLTEPFAMPADDFVVRRLLGVLKESVSSPIDEAGAPHLGKFGLSEPWAIIDFDGAEIAFGDTNPLAGRRYVRTDAGVYLIPDTHLFALERGVYGLVSSRLVPAEARIDRLSMNGLRVERAPQGGWRLVPPRPEVSSDQLEAWIERWEQADALRVVPAEADEDPARDEIRVELQTGEVLQFVVLARQPELVMMRRGAGIAYHLPAAQYERLLQPPELENPASTAPD